MSGAFDRSWPLRGVEAAAASPASSAGDHARWRASLARLTPVLLALAAFGAVAAAIGPWPVGVFQDDGIYLILGKSLATGQGYRYLNLPGEPNATHYPPLFPAWLAMLWRMAPEFPRNVTLFKFANALLIGIAAPLFYRLARERMQLGRLPSALGVLAFTACAPVVLLSVMVLSEPMFLALLAPTLLVSDRASASGSRREAALAGVLGGVLALVRTLGIVIVPATALVLLWRRRWQAAIICCVSAALVLAPWQLWSAAHAAEVPRIFLGKYGSYLGWLTDAVRTDGLTFVRDVAWTNLKSLVAQGWASTATDTLGPWVRNSTSIALAFFFGLGMGALARRTPVIAIFTATYLGIVVIWPFAPARFTWGVWPVVGLVFALALASVWEWRGEHEGDHPRLRQLLRPIALVAFAGITVGYAGYNYLGVTRDWWTVVQSSVANRARPLGEWITANTDSSAVLATDDDALLYLYTGRRTIPNGAFTPQEHITPQTPAFAVQSLRTILATYQVDFVLASTNYGTYAVRGLVQQPIAELRIVGALQTGGVFAPVKGGRAE